MISYAKDLNKLRSQELTDLKSQITRERRLLEDIHQKNKSSLKETHQKEIVEIKNDHNQKILNEQINNEKVLLELKEKLALTKDLTEKQLSQLKDEAKREEGKIAADHLQKRNIQNLAQEQSLQSANERYNEQLRKINSEGEDLILQTKENLAYKHNSTAQNLEQKLQDTSNQYQTKIQEQEKSGKRDLYNKKEEYKKKDKTLTEEHERRIVEQTRTHQNLYKTRDDDFKQKFHEQDLFFEKKFETQLASHHGQLQKLNKKFDQLVHQSKSDFLEELKSTKEKENDLFFEFTELKTNLSDKGDHYILDVVIPDYAKKDLTLTTNNKELILTLNRRYQDQVENDGVKHRVNKVETLSSRLPTQHHIDSKKISSNYRDGVMTYKIAKS